MWSEVVSLLQEQQLNQSPHMPVKHKSSKIKNK